MIFQSYVHSCERVFPKKDPVYFDPQQTFTYLKQTLEKLEEGVEYT